MSDRIVITGMGIVSPLGSSIEEFWNRLNRMETSVQSWNDLAEEGFRVTQACRAERIEVDPMFRGRHLALEAAGQAIAMAGGIEKKTDIFIGSTLGESFAFENKAEGAEIDLYQHSIDSFGKYIVRELKLAGMQHNVATACSAGNYAISMAMSSLKQRRINCALAGGAEPFSKLAMVGFSRSRAMAADFCKPFDVLRSGMTLGEGAAMFVIEREEDALERGATPIAELLAVGLTSDAHHATAPAPDGSGIKRAMIQALKLGGINAEDIHWVNSHGTGTRLSDAAEGRAILELFNKQLPAISGSKGAIGHALGASSAIELGICILGLRDQVIPPTYGFKSVDPDIGIQCTSKSITGEVRYVLNNAMAFGGINSSVLLKRWEG